ALAIPLLLTAIYFAETKRPWLYAVAVLLTLATREDAAIAVVGLGLWLALTKRRWIWGCVTAVGAFALLLVDTRWLIPYFRGAPYPPLGRYSHRGHSVREILEPLVLPPGRVLATVFTAKRLESLGALLAPLAFLPLLAPAPLLGLVPPLAENLLG